MSWQDAEAGVGGVNGHSGFVTFNDVRDARVAMNVKLLGRVIDTRLGLLGLLYSSRSRLSGNVAAARGSPRTAIFGKCRSRHHPRRLSDEQLK